MPCSHEVVSAAVMRIFGQELAELPIVATSSKSQGQVIGSVFYHRCVDELVFCLYLCNYSLINFYTRRKHFRLKNMYSLSICRVIFRHCLLVLKSYLGFSM